MKLKFKRLLIESINRFIRAFYTRIFKDHFRALISGKVKVKVLKISDKVALSD